MTFPTEVEVVWALAHASLMITLPRGLKPTLQGLLSETSLMAVFDVADKTPPRLPGWFPHLCATAISEHFGSAKAREPLGQAQWRDFIGSVLLDFTNGLPPGHVVFSGRHHSTAMRSATPHTAVH